MDSEVLRLIYSNSTPSRSTSQHAYSSIPNRPFDDTKSDQNDNDDAVSLGIRTLCSRWAVTIYLWLTSYILVMLQDIFSQYVVIWPAVLFIPMWAGSIYAIVMITIALYNICGDETRLISPEQSMFLRSQGRLGSLYIDYESLPLLRRLFFWGIASAFFALMAAITQVLFYLWLVDGIIGMWNALFPVIVMILLLLTYMFALSTISYNTSILATLLVVDMILFAIKISGEVSLPWVLVITPVLIVQISWIWHVIYLCQKSLAGEFSLKLYQKYCIVLYILSFMLGITGEFITLIDNGNEVPGPQSAISEVCWLLAVVAFVVAGNLVMVGEGGIIADSKGYTDPKPISHTQEGWVVLKDVHSHVSLLLGTIKVAKLELTTLTAGAPPLEMVPFTPGFPAGVLRKDCSGIGADGDNGI